MGKNFAMKQARTEKGFSQQELADRLGVSRQTVNAIEKGTIILPSNYALEFAAAWVLL